MHLALLLLLACVPEEPPPAPPAPPPAAANPDLAAQAKLFERAVLEPVEGIYVAVGFGLANVIAIEAPDGLVIVDTTEGATPAAEALAALREHTDAPVVAVIYTHNHADHVMGAQVFVDADADGPGGSVPPVWAHSTTEARIDEVVSVLRDAISVRSQRMFGTALDADVGGDGIGMRLRFDGSDVALVRPTNTVHDRRAVVLGGEPMELVHAPGETSDQIFVWLPRRKVLLPGDNVYQAFPNLYTIRGTPYRDVRAWVDSIDAMRDLGAEALVPSHTRPVVGADAVEDVLVHYRDAIQYVHDQTIRGVNAGRTPDELAATIALPAHLASHPWLAEHYGRVPWSVRGIYAGTIGWFSGDSAELEPLPPDERARRYAAAFAQDVPLPVQVQAALATGEYAWAAELATLWTRAEPDSQPARDALADALDGLAAGHVNANARNWYRTQARELRGEIVLTASPPRDAPDAFVDALPLAAFMRGMGPRLRAEAVLDTDQIVAYHFTDVDEHWIMHVRHGVAEVRQRSPEQIAALAPQITVTTTARTWKRIAAGKEKPIDAVAARELEVDGSLRAVGEMLDWFDRPPTD
ncbi:MAG: MBL fold metallo-hydrolase [Alphaproteobacteria bacterium]|nr:MBL fold metallo-hydrolase [Alphaproteobacteria bacterium]